MELGIPTNKGRFDSLSAKQVMDVCYQPYLILLFWYYRI